MNKFLAYDAANNDYETFDTFDEAWGGKMNREISFRGMDVSGKWHYGLLSQDLRNDPGYYISNKAGSPFAYKVRPETIGQFTGMGDKNATKIYEGDILLKRSTEIFDGSDDLKWEVKFTCTDYNSFFDFGYMSRPSSCEIIGNIHEEGK